MEKNLQTIYLMDIYGKMLTARQREILSSYYEYDLSLAEIALNLSISRQAVLDSLNNSEKLLNEYEEKLQLLKIKEMVARAINADEKQRLNILNELEKIL